MPFCPKCRVEYRPGFTRCSDCDTDLVERLDVAPSWEGAEPVELTRKQDSSQARLICDALLQSGVPCFLKGIEGKEILGPILGASFFDGADLNDIAILVPEDRIEEAQNILDAFFEEDSDEGDIQFLECSECGCPIDEEDEVCPACGEKLTE